MQYSFKFSKDVVPLLLKLAPGLFLESLILHVMSSFVYTFASYIHSKLMVHVCKTKPMVGVHSLTRIPIDMQLRPYIYSPGNI